MHYHPMPDGLTAQEAEAFHQERLRLMEMYVQYNDQSLQGRPCRMLVGVRVDRRGVPLVRDGETVEDFYESVRAAAKAMRAPMTMMMRLARLKREKFGRIWRYATHDDMEKRGIL